MWSETPTASWTSSSSEFRNNDPTMRPQQTLTLQSYSPSALKAPAHFEGPSRGSQFGRLHEDLGVEVLTNCFAASDDAALGGNPESITLDNLEGTSALAVFVVVDSYVEEPYTLEVTLR